MLHRFIQKPQNPLAQNLWTSLRFLLAALIVPEVKVRRDTLIQEFFNHEYLISVTKHYEREIRSTAKALTKRNKQNKQLQARVKELEEQLDKAQFELKVASL